MAKSKRTRKSRTKSIKKEISISIACEDSAGGLKYITELIKSYGFIPKNTCLNKNFTDLKGLVEQVLNEKNLKIVFVDVDDKLKSQGNKNNVNSGIQKARNNNICIIVSNECLELWFLLHFEEQTTFINRYEIFKKLKKHLLNHKKNVLPKNTIHNLEQNKIKNIDWFMILDNNEKELAIKRCKKLIKSKSPLNPWKENPITLMCCFIDFLEKISAINNNIKLTQKEKKNKILETFQKCYPITGMEINV